MKFAGGFNVCAKRIISQTGKPGDCNKMPFEIMPCCTRLSAGCKFKCRVHYEGTPVGEDIMFIAFRAETGDGIPVKTDKDGYAKFTLDRNGEYMILALLEDSTKSVEGEYDARSYESTYTVVVS